MNLQQLLASLTPDIYHSLKRAVELGKWPDGNRLTQAQRELCMQAVIAYEHKNLPQDTHTGYIPPEPHSFCGSDHEHEDHDKPIKWVE
ncbi:YeaC family protein [Cellvibrio japonicus]|uniref:DUF1315 domain-containing protein n=1 Tax=Cellvibrio japonicus (strain Ueda107) TaxID=498211 RepID=B3PJ61_CELJU|nr:YeaC family protein [Cellvibrio japonicus]ACE84512.1 conserved hypothetical protein [Cellvibrio japonicus Ueda107]QEI12623.1 DUF1315 family protein [Cellvibrio japonicus]QEI16197.1 DUF1315 family protein [Cellvibrio japonicus]QEI19775.1 DUF1315 family protein [Cellvibrio japonicus]